MVNSMSSLLESHLNWAGSLKRTSEGPDTFNFNSTAGMGSEKGDNSLD